ncbi:phosphoglucomutase (alpha-D-glucose-1,6-bisphosphate-dependent) [Nitrincola sp.]|uniref:phosphoglucomutase (alpha-D-glucose-1,6-bisphosphate-dependent) n=1 Tax=Nitrincola sp. TaxID=1926584 RepID=UPI003A8D5FC1
MQALSIPSLISAYFQKAPDPSVAAQRVSFGTSGHRGASTNGSFNQAHIWAITQAIVEYRTAAGIFGPLFLGIDTHALSVPAYGSAIEVLIAQGVDVRVHPNGGYTPTPLISHAILQHNLHQPDALADGIVITPSHNPPGDGGIKYNTPDGGPAASSVTREIQDRANALLERGLSGIKRVTQDEANAAVTPFDFVDLYVSHLPEVVNISAIERFGLRIGVDPMGGTALEVWQAIASRFHLHLSIVNTSQDPTFAFMPLDHDGQIRMDCSSPHAMANLLDLKDRYDLALANDPDADRHGIVDIAGLMNPNHFLAVAVDYLLTHRPQWSPDLAIGKTLVSSSILDRVVAKHGRTLYEVPVGFKWFVEGLHQKRLAFAGEESAGASFLTMAGEPWSTDKDGILLCLLAAELFAVTGKSPSQYYQELTQTLGLPYYKRIDAPATPAEKKVLGWLQASHIRSSHLVGEPITDILVKASGNVEAIGGVKVITANGWFAARPSGTESIYKIYAESFVDQAHLDQLVIEAKVIVDDMLSNLA